MQIIPAALLALTLTNICADTWASDHIDGVPIPGTHRQIDLSDLYVFPAPGNKNRLSILLNVYPGVADNGHFSEKVNYKIIIQEVKPETSRKRFEILDGSASVLDCRFSEHQSGFWLFGTDQPGTAYCALSRQNKTIAQIAADVGTMQTSADRRIYFFAGPRSDPFFLASEQFIPVTKRKGFPTPAGENHGNSLENLNVLTLAFEFDYELIGGADDKYYAIAAEAYTDYKRQNTHLDRIGRAEITNLSLHSYDDATKIKRKYNRYRAFQNELANTQNVFRERLKSNISAYDRYDEKRDWTDEDLQALTTVLLDDYLVINSAENCAREGNGYMRLEKALLLGEALNHCGGRELTDDIMNTLYALYIGGSAGRLSDFATGITRPYARSDKQLNSDFPYLAPADSSIFKRLLAKILYYKQD